VDNLPRAERHLAALEQICLLSCEELDDLRAAVVDFRRRKRRFGGVPGAILAYISLPFQGRAPIQDPEVRFYQIGGPLAVIPAPLFWILVNIAYWLFWLNIMLGATNALPAVPLDGGYIFKDAIEGLVSRLRKGIGAEQRDRIVRGVSYTFAFLILGLVLWQLIGPRI